MRPCFMRKSRASSVQDSGAQRHFNLCQYVLSAATPPGNQGAWGPRGLPAPQNRLTHRQAARKDRAQNWSQKRARENWSKFLFESQNIEGAKWRKTCYTVKEVTGEKAVSVEDNHAEGSRAACTDGSKHMRKDKRPTQAACPRTRRACEGCFHGNWKPSAILLGASLGLWRGRAFTSTR